jgi:hypothetical protein
VKEIFLLFIAFRLALASTQPLIERIQKALPLEIKREGREADYSPSSSAEVVKKSGAIPPLPTCFHSIQLNYIMKYKDA